MNTDQISSLVRSVILLVGSILATYGLTKAAGIANSESFIGVAITITTLVYNHFYHSNAALKERFDKAGLKIINKMGSPVLFLALCIGITGCAKVAYNSDKGTMIHERVFGVDISSSSTDSPMKVRLGYVSSVFAIVPTSTNQLYAAPMLDTFDNSTGWLVNSKMSERVGTGIAVSNLAVTTTTNFYSVTNK